MCEYDLCAWVYARVDVCVRVDVCAFFLEQEKFHKALQNGRLGPV